MPDFSAEELVYNIIMKVLVRDRDRFEAECMDKNMTPEHIAATLIVEELNAKRAEEDATRNMGPRKN